MVHQTSHRYIQAIMNLLKFIILDYLAVREIWDFGLTERFLRLFHKQSVFRR